MCFCNDAISIVELLLQVTAVMPSHTPSNPFPVFTPFSVPSTRKVPMPTPPSLELIWDPSDIMSSALDALSSWSMEHILKEYTHIYSWLLALELSWHASSPQSHLDTKVQPTWL